MYSVGGVGSTALAVAISFILQGCVPLPEEGKPDKKFLEIETTTTLPYKFIKWTVTSTTRTETSHTGENFETTDDPGNEDGMNLTDVVPRTTEVPCTAFGEDCTMSRCCQNETMQCYQKDETWSSCKPSCVVGEIDPDDPPGFFTPWSCFVLSKMSKGWANGTFTTGYWDCCKPSCAWPGKGNVNQPARSCAAGTQQYLEDASITGVCDMGGSAAACPDNQPFAVNSNLSMGFAAAAVGGGHGLAGDENCGQCFELLFTDEKHDYGGGSHPSLVGKTMIVQVNNIGYDVSGTHAFDIQIPGAGQGLFYGGCGTQFPGVPIGDFDCDQRYGGCGNITGCELQPPELRAGCEWRFLWYKWKVSAGTTDNPFISFRRVKCPKQLTDISGSIPNDDDDFPVIDPDSYR